MNESPDRLSRFVLGMLALLGAVLAVIGWYFVVRQ